MAEQGPENEEKSRRDSSGRDSSEPEKREGPDNQQKPPQNFISKTAMGWILLGGLVILLFVLMSNAQNRAESVPWQTFLHHAQSGDFQEPVLVENTRITGILKPETRGVEATRSASPRRVSFEIDRQSKVWYLDQLNRANQDHVARSGDSILMPFLLHWGPLILIAFLIWFFLFRGLRNAGGGAGMLGNFGRSRHKVTNKEHSNVTLNDVAGIDEAKDEVNEIVEFLKSPKKFQRLGGRVPRGVLLIGEPGCGKTLLAKAVAGEADVPFFSISGSDFVEMFVGVGASRVRDLFKQAKDNSPCIIFLDEIDAVGRKRGSGFSSGGHDEREQTLNAILVEMDGFDSSDQVIVMAATNRNDVLDPALTRPGRFDRQIHVPLPDLRGRAEILSVHAKRVKMGPNVDLEKLARGTPMFSGADLAAIINEAAIGATLQGKDYVEQADLEEARDKVKWGRARKSHRVDEDEKRVIAFHEAGHALVMCFDEDSEPLHKVTIIPRGMGLGVTFSLPEKDRHIWTRRQLLAKLRVTFGGRIAEEMECGDISSGAAMDIRQATSIARAMVMQWGMSEKLGFQLLGSDETKNPWEQPDKYYSEETARLIDDEVGRLIQETYQQTRTMLENHREELVRLAEALLKYETLSREEVDRLLKGELLDKPTVGDLLRAEREKMKDAGGKDRAQSPRSESDDSPGVVPSPA
ncbi:MAG: ATP-dependent zinc metalloprotease FtsH [Phycisphaeraceae bacterium]|nr:ATP-dependent zinc metalloprotease FtsH [Phycisphaeraceae bacterium]